MDVTLTVEPGRTLGTRPSRRLRAEGMVPAVIYGQGTDPQPVSVAWPDLRKALTTEAGVNALITLQLDGESNLSIVKDIQRHPVRRDVLHVDFQLISRDEELTVEVPINLVGEAKAVESAKGTVDQIMYTLTVKAKPGFIPNALEANIDDLEVGTTVTVADIALPDGVSTDVDPEEPVVSGSASRATIEADAGEGGEGEGDDDGEGGGDAAEGEGGEG
jgi:large subunit ribosomal protein L25